MLSLDVMGSTPLFKSGLHGDRLLRVVLDERRCTGEGMCEQVCPRNCYVLDHDRRVATMPGTDKCVQCGACIIQCPLDALCFVDAEGGAISPQSTRELRLNLRGQRVLRRDTLCNLLH